MSLYLQQINRHRHAESFRRWGYSDPYSDSNMKSETETYATDLIYMKLPGITWIDPKLKAFLMKMNRIIHWLQFCRE